MAFGLAWLVVLACYGLLMWMWTRFPAPLAPKRIEPGPSVAAQPPREPRAPSKLRLDFAKALGFGAAYPVYFLWKNPSIEVFSTAGLPLVLACGVLSATGLVLRASYWAKLRAFQSFRGAAILEGLLRGNTATEPFSVFLRPFAADDSFATRNPQHGVAPVLPSYYSEEEHTRLETLLTEAESPRILIALDSREGDHTSGAIGYVAQSNREWKRAVRVLVASATRVLVVSGGGRNSLWELALLKRKKLLGKTVLVMPPATSLDRNAKKQAPAQWTGIQRRLLVRGMELPDYDLRGRLFSLDPRGKLNAAEPFQADAKWVAQRSADLLKPRDSAVKPTKITRFGKRALWVGGALMTILMVALVAGQCQRDVSLMVDNPAPSTPWAAPAGGPSSSPQEPEPLSTPPEQSTDGPNIRIPEPSSCHRIPTIPGIAPNERFVGAVECLFDFVSFVAAVVEPPKTNRYLPSTFETRVAMSEADRAEEFLSDTGWTVSNVDVDILERTSNAVTYTVQARVGPLLTLSAFSEVRLKDRVLVLRMATRPPSTDLGPSVRDWSLSFVRAFVRGNAPADAP